MSITIELPDATLASLTRSAQLQGLDTPEYARRVLENDAQTASPDAAARLLAQLQATHQQLDDAHFAGINGETELRSVRDGEEGADRA